MAIKVVFFIVLLLNNSKLLSQNLMFDSLRNELSVAESIDKKLDIQLEMAHYFAEVNLDSAKFYAGKLVAYSKNTCDSSILYSAYLKYALAYLVHQKAKPDSLWLYFDSAYSVAKKSSYYRGITNCYQFRGVVYYYLNDYEKSIKDFIIASERYAFEKDTPSLAICKYNLGDIYKLSGNNQKAITLLNEAAEIYKNIEQKHVYYLLQTTLGELYCDQEEFDKMLDCHKQVYFAKIKVENRTDELIDYTTNLAKAYFLIGNNDSAKYYFNKVEELGNINSRDSIFDYIYLEPAKYLIAQKNYKKAEILLLKSLDFSKRKHYTTEELSILECLSGLYELTNKNRLALTYLHQHISLRDSMKLEGIGNLLDKAIAEQHLKEKEEHLKQLIIKNQQLINPAIIVIVLFILALLLYSIVWIFQVKLFMNYSKELDKINQQKELSLLKFKLPNVTLKNKFLVIISLFFGLTNGTILFTILKTPSIFANVLFFCLLASIHCFLIIKIYYKYRSIKQLSNKQELLFMFAATIISSLLLFMYQYILEGKFDLIHSLNIFLVSIASTLISLTIEALIRYKKSLLLYLDKTIAMYNKLMAIKDKERPSLNSEVVVKNQIVYFDNLGKKEEIDITNVLYIVSENVYQEFISYENKSIHKTLIRNTMGNIEKTLSKYSNFYRCHRSYIINTQSIKAIEGNSRQYYFVLKNTKEKIPVSRSAAKETVKNFATLFNN